MSITTLSFILFITVILVVYYIVPRKLQWILLLVSSVFFYISGGWQYFLYVIITASTIFLAAKAIQAIDSKKKVYLKENKSKLTKESIKKYKLTNKRKRKAILITVLLVNIGILCYFKYIHFLLEQINVILSWFGTAPIEDTFSFILPLGISFYTFQAIGYLLDVYWEYYKPENNYFKFLLFVSFFPQITQGPISSFEQLSKELFSEHAFDHKNFSWGFQRMVWGFFKKMLIADTLSPWVNNVFQNYSTYSGVSVLIGAFTYSIQIYADFSGYMDIMCGLCEMLGISLPENFDRPYFSKSIAEYWRKWHITMGTWFKKYIYYPIAMSPSSRKLAKSTSKFGKHFSETLPATIALIVTWLATGLWHGASWAYIVWGLVNGLFLILSLWLEPIYISSKKALKIKDTNKIWIAFQLLRTFILVTFIKVLPEVGTLSDGLRFLGRIFTNHSVPHSLSELLPFIDTSITVYKINFAIAMFGIVMMIIISVVQYKKTARYYFNKLPKPLRLLALSGLLILIATFGVQASWGSGGFLYAQF